MALELQINSQKAEQAFERIEKSVETLRGSLERLGASGNSFQTIASALAGIRIDPAVARTSSDLAKALSSLNNATNIGNIAQGLSQLSRVNFNQVANDVGRFAIALATIRVPPQLAQLASAFQAVGMAATQAGTRVQQFGNQTQNAGGQIQGFAGGMSAANNMLSAFGLSLGAVGFARFIQSAFEATSQLDAFKAQMMNLYGGVDAARQTEFATAQFQFLRRVARETGQDLQGLVPAYARFAQASVRSGVSAADTASNFAKLSTAFRVLGLSSDQTNGAFRAFEQMTTKGRIQAEELTQQLGDRGVPALQAMATALGMNAQKLDEMMRAGRLSASEISKMIDALHNMTAPGLAAALNTLGARFNQLKTVMYELTLAFGEGFFTRVASGLGSLVAALGSPAVLEAANSLGRVIGSIAEGFMGAVSAAITFGAAIYNAVAPAISWLMDGINVVLQWAFGFDAATAGAANFGQVIGFAIGGLVMFLAVGAGLQAIALTFRAIAATVALIQLAMTRALIPIIAVAVGITALVVGYRMLKGDTEGAASAQGFMSTMLNTVTGGMMEAASAMNNTATQYEAVGSAAQDNTRATQGNTEAMRAYNAETQRMNAAARADETTRRRLTQEMNALTGATNGHTSAVRTNTDALGGTAGAAGGAAGGIAGLNGALGANAGAFNSATAAANRYQSAISGGGRADLRPSQLQSILPDRVDGRIIRRQDADARDATTIGIDANGDYYDLKQGTGGSDGYTRNYDYLDSQQSYNLDYDKSGPTEYFNADQNTYDYMQKGGLVGRATQSVRVPSSVFADAPKFADGGYTPGSGEVPIIAHQGEAVVPLPDGRSIPVTFTGGAGYDVNSPNAAGSISLIDQVRALGVVFKIESDRWVQALENNNVLLTVIANNSIRSGTSTGGDTTSPDPTAPVAPANPGAPRKGFFGYGSGGNSGTYGADNRFFIDEDGTVKPVSLMGGGGSGGGGTGGSIPKFAAGTPNTSGGGLAILHPNEAVIPLPDGRRVPVNLTMPADYYSPLRRAPEANTRSTTSSSSSSSGAGRTVVNMYISTPDVGSFRASQDQMLKDLATKLDRATTRIGTNSSVDDPTQRRR